MNYEKGGETRAVAVSPKDGLHDRCVFLLEGRLKDGIGIEPKAVAGRIPFRTDGTSKD